MEPRVWLRGGSLLVAVGALAALVLHACASTSATSSPHNAPVQAATAQQGSTENASWPPPMPATANPPATATATANDDDDDGAPYMPATKAGPGIVLSKPKHPKAPPQVQAANPPPQVAAP